MNRRASEHLLSHTGEVGSTYLASKHVLGLGPYRPDYLVRLTSGKLLILEVKRQDTQQDATKRGFLAEWIRAVNQHGGFGEWSADVSRNPRDLLNILATHNSTAA